MQDSCRIFRPGPKYSAPEHRRRNGGAFRQPARAGGGRNPAAAGLLRRFLSLAIVRQSDREMWTHRRAFLTRYQKAELIEHLL